MSTRKYPKIAKKIPGKKKWYFRPSSVKLSTVLRNIRLFEKWSYSKKNRTKHVSITRKNVKDLVLISLIEIKDNYHKYRLLNILDGWIIYKWLRLKRINFERFDEQKMYILNNPLIHPSTNPELQDYYYFCLQQDKQIPETWKWKILPRTYINGNGSYKVLCLPISQ